MFSDSLSYFNVLFLLREIEMISAPFIPMSLSSSLNASSFLFCNKTAAKTLAPSIPKEFFLIEPSIIPKSKTFKLSFLINYSIVKDNPTSLIMLLAKFKFSILHELTKFLTACMPYSDIALSARLMVLKCWFSKMLISFIIVLTPSLIE